MGEIDAAFIQSPEHRPKLSIIEAEGIPVIDLSPLLSNTTSSITNHSSLEELVKEIGNACREWGFFQSKEEKSKVRRDNDGVKVMGYYDSEHTKNVRDWKEVFDYTVEEPTMMPASLDPNYHKELTHWYNQWPQYPPEFRIVTILLYREAFQEYAQHMEGLALKLMELIALSLGLPPKRFHGFFKDQTSWIRLNFYPPCPSPNLVLGLGRHKDSGALTVLAQDDVSGLEVKRKSDGEWIRVKPTTPDFILSMLET
ncbi:hypothetical protein JHK86_019106 [Glycine max]|nr:hypothetical protein JHK86_019106 [Glycine max]